MKSLCAVSCAVLVAVSEGCTYFTVDTPQGEVVGRSMEFGGLSPKEKDEPVPWYVIKTGKNSIFEHNEVAKQCELSHDWKGKYSHVGIAGGPDKQQLNEAINTEGLSVQSHTLRLSQYQKPNTTGTKNICFNNLATYIVSSFASVAEVSAALKNDVSVIGESGTFFHWAVTDKYHQAIVIEYVNGQLNIHNNTVRVMTNDPHFDFHLQNLNQYVWIGTSWSNQTAISVDSEIGVVPKQISHGINLGGIPGDVSPPSRFVKLFYLKQYSQMNTPPQNISDGIILATSILNTVFIPKGVVSFKSSESSYDFTEYSTLKIPSKAQFYFKSYQNNQWRMVDLNKLTFEVGKATFIPVNNGDTGIKDVTGEL
eukprot:TRINITY_DN14444_c0_g1_i12.p1 TRINITY_DN14444_c0_g1~~TRINITY_DN14444_c0_g1_i12.p1  ORF type:complete len:427 (+),score=70.01 TRINITY_DN14444_c0_g1_i12:183-1283(+)